MLMETKNEKDLRVYVQPETEIVMIGGDSVIMQDILPASGASDTDL